MYSYGPPHMAKQKQDDQLELTYSSYVRTQDVILKTCQRRWIIWRSGERGLGISVLAARHDDDDDDLLARNAFQSNKKKSFFYFHGFVVLGAQIVPKDISLKVNSLTPILDVNYFPMGPTPPLRIFFQSLVTVLVSGTGFRIDEFLKSRKRDESIKFNNSSGRLL